MAPSCSHATPNKIGRLLQQKLSLFVVKLTKFKRNTGAPIAMICHILPMLHKSPKLWTLWQIQLFRKPPPISFDIPWRMPNFLLLNNKQMPIVFIVPLFPKSPPFPILNVMNTMTVSPVLLHIFTNRIRHLMLFLLLLKKLPMHSTIYHITKLRVKMVFTMRFYPIYTARLAVSCYNLSIASGKREYYQVPFDDPLFCLFLNLIAQLMNAKAIAPLLLLPVFANCWNDLWLLIYLIIWKQPALSHLLPVAFDEDGLLTILWCDSFLMFYLAFNTNHTFAQFLHHWILHQHTTEWTISLYWIFSANLAFLQFMLIFTKVSLQIAFSGSELAMFSVVGLKNLQVYPKEVSLLHYYLSFTWSPSFDMFYQLLPNVELHFQCLLMTLIYGQLVLLFLFLPTNFLILQQHQLYHGVIPITWSSVQRNVELSSLAFPPKIQTLSLSSMIAVLKIGSDTCHSCIRILGVHFDHLFTFKHHVQHLCQKTNLHLCQLSRVLSSICGSSQSDLRTMCVAHVHSVLEHAAPIWHPCFIREDKIVLRGPLLILKIFN